MDQKHLVFNMLARVLFHIPFFNYYLMTEIKEILGK